MPDAQTLLIFVPVALALNLTPGADMLFCLGQGMRSGPRAGIAAALGVAVGGMAHALAAGLGLAALLEAYPLAFEAVRWAGVAYLAWIGVQAFRAPAPQAGAAPRFSAGRALREGALVCLFNPKVAIFMLALVPQFIRPEAGPVLGQFLVFGSVLMAGGAVVNALVGGFAGRLGRGFARARAVRWGSGGLFLGLAAGLALERR
ncbi:LysE family translocator [Rhodobacteraceae bacterium 2CG4]|uniref:LysE family translocator n=1 Tax=Halovulum marinum TaxID=2662447 RepID=A0A6L5Z2E5_9RHOB|nr:LysE family translocator [Halovulum marinum]MSU90697.1 LysE family translocator [Halovulum marinum]